MTPRVLIARSRLMNVAEFLQRQRKYDLIRGERLGAIEAEFSERGDEDAEPLATRLVTEGALTKYQSEVLLSGSAERLTYGACEILDRIGAGGMGHVFKAKHRSMNRVVAVKTLPPQMMMSPDAVTRFQREVEAAAALEHPNIVMAFDAGNASGVHYLVMQYVEGRDLAATVRQRGPFSVGEALHLIMQAARGLAYAHSHGIIHRDIKPANLLLTNDGVVKILDMGLARLGASDHELTHSGAVMGTIDYMAPEQAEDSHRVDGRADIYSLGHTLHYLLTGSVAFPGDTLVQKLLAHRESPAPSLHQSVSGVADDVNAIFQRMVAKRPQDRYPDIESLIADLQALGVAEPAWQASSNAAHTDHNAEETLAIQRHDLPTGADNLLSPTAQLSAPFDGNSPTMAPDAVTQPGQSGPTLAPPRSSSTWLVVAIALVGCGLIALVVVLLNQESESPSDEVRSAPNLANLIEQVEPGVVRINVTKNDGSGIGSGFVVDSRGWVVTNLHVVRGAISATTSFPNQAVAEVEGILAIDAEADLALLKIAAASAPVVLPIAAEIPRKGERVVAFGAPRGFSFSATEGIVSAVRTGREIRDSVLAATGIDRRGQPGHDANTTWIQTTAPISHGNSGGPLTNEYGEVIGVNTWVHGGGQNLNFAASSTAVAQLVRAAGSEPPLILLADLEGLEGAAPAPRITETLAERLRGDKQGQLYIFESHGAPILDIAISPDGRYLAAAGGDRVSLLDLTTLTVVFQLESKGEFHCVDFSADAELIYTGGRDEAEDRNIKFWRRATSDLELRIIGRKTGTKSIAASGDGAKFVSTHDEGIVDLRFLSQPGDSFPLLAHERTWTCFDATFSPDSKLLLTSGGDGRLFIWNVEGGAPLGVSRMLAHQAPIRSCTFSPNGKSIASASTDGMIRIWSDWQEQDNWRLTQSLKGHVGEVTSVAFSPNGKTLVSGGGDGTLRVWDIATSSEIRTSLKGHSQRITDVCLLVQSGLIATSSEDGAVRFWRVDEIK